MNGMVSSSVPTALEQLSLGNWRHWFGVVRASWPAIVGLTVLGASSAAAWSSRQPKVYEAHASLEYSFGVGEASEQAAGGDSRELAYMADRELIRTQNFILKSRLLAERVVRRLALDKHSAANRHVAFHHNNSAFERAVAQVQAAVDVAPIPSTRIAGISVRDSTPEGAARIANALVDSYLEKTLEDREDASSRALDWLRGQQADLKPEVEASERAVFKFREDHQSLATSLDERRRIVAEQQGTYGDELTSLRIKRVHAQARLSVLKEALASQSDPLTVQAGPIAADPIVLSLRERYRNLVTLLKQLSQSQAAGSPQVLAAEGELETIRVQLGLQLDAILHGAQADLKEIERSETGMQQALAQVHQQSLALSREELEFASLERQRASQAERYSLVLERMAKADLARALKASPARVVDRAVPVAEPVAPRVRWATAVGGLLGLLVGVLGAILRRARQV